jgi:hypothetical protein
MKQCLSVVAFVYFLFNFLSPIGVHAAATLPAASHAQVRVTILSSSGSSALAKKTLVALHLRIQGLILDANHIGKKPISGHGHVQVYLDRVPSDAYKTPDLRGMVAITAGELFSVDLTKSPAKSHPGKHKLIVALAKNNYVLYRIPTATLSITVK